MPRFLHCLLSNNLKAICLQKINWITSGNLQDFSICWNAIWKSWGSEVRGQWLGDNVSLWGSWPPWGAFGKFMGSKWVIQHIQNLFRTAWEGAHSPGALMHCSITDPYEVPAESLKVCDFMLWKGGGADANPWGQKRSKRALPKVRRHTQPRKNS